MPIKSTTTTEVEGGEKKIQKNLQSKSKHMNNKCFPWAVSCLYSELQADVCKNPKGQGIVSSLYSERFNGKEENIRVSIFHLEGNGRMLGLGGSFLTSSIQVLVC